LASTLANVRAALANEGVVFSADGSVRIVPKTQIIRFPKGTSAESKAFAIQLPNAGQKARGEPPFIMGEDE
jgi:hypothetical protein